MGEPSPSQGDEGPGSYPPPPHHHHPHHPPPPGYHPMPGYHAGQHPPPYGGPPGGPPPGSAPPPSPYHPQAGQYMHGPPPPGAGPPPPGSYAAPYGGPPPSHYGGGPPPPHHPHHHPPPPQYGYGAPPPPGARGGPPPPPYPYGAYDSGGYYPSQQAAKHHAAYKGRGVGSSPTRKDKAESRSDDSNPSTKPVDMLEAERLKASADTELTLSEVKPIQTDFHFFVMEMKDKLRLEAEQEVKASGGGDSLKNAYLINTNLNSRLMKAWEDLSNSQREGYAKKEEADRRRFMEEDEVASRHCATLTARVRSPAEPGLSSAAAARNNTKQEAKATKREETEIKKEEEEQSSPGESKRAAPASSVEAEDDASPSKKNRIDEEGEDAADDA